MLIGMDPNSQRETFHSTTDSCGEYQAQMSIQDVKLPVAIEVVNNIVHMDLLELIPHERTPLAERSSHEISHPKSRHCDPPKNLERAEIE